jgi:hypothetical protein
MGQIGIDFITGVGVSRSHSPAALMKKTQSTKVGNLPPTSTVVAVANNNKRGKEGSSEVEARVQNLQQVQGRCCADVYNMIHRYDASIACIVPVQYRYKYQYDTGRLILCTSTSCNCSGSLRSLRYCDR